MKIVSLLILSLCIASAACGGPDSAVSGASGSQGQTAAANTAGTAACDMQTTAKRALAAIEPRDYAALARLVHPTKGVRFSPYATVQPETDQHFTAAGLAAVDDTAVHIWGHLDGSGEPIELSVADYFDRFVYDRDFAAARGGPVDTRLGAGNSIDNIGQVYDEAHFIEFYVPAGNPDYAGMDWASLRLVFEDFKSCAMLVGIVHDQWTI